MAEIEVELEDEVEAMEELYDPLREELDVVALRPRRTDVTIESVALAWVPYEIADDGSRRWLMRTGAQSA